jgi:hypothetical protein
MAGQISAKSGKVKKSKLDKIFELEAELKVIKGENARLHKALSAKNNHQNESEPASSESDPTDASDQSDKMKRMKEAFITLKNVTVTQEKSLHSMRSKALQRRKEIQQKDSDIACLQKKVKTLQRIQEGLAKAKCPESLKAELDELQMAYFDEQSITAKLEQKLVEKEKAVSSLQTLLQVKAAASRRGSVVSRRGSECSSPSLDSDSEFSQLKKELGKKSRQIVELQHDLESATEKLHELRSKSQTELSSTSHSMDESEFLETEHPFETEHDSDNTEDDHLVRKRDECTVATRELYLD